MALFKREKKETAEASAPAVNELPQNASLASGRLAPVFQRMYLLVLSVDLTHNVYQVESGAAAFMGQKFPIRGRYDQLFQTLETTFTPDFQDAFRESFRAQALLDAFGSGRTNVSALLCAGEVSAAVPACIELRAERIPEDRGRVTAFLLYVRRVQDENDTGSVRAKSAVQRDETGGIDWKAVRDRKRSGGVIAMEYEYDIASDRFILHSGVGEEMRTGVTEKYLSTLDARGDYIVSHESVQALRDLMRKGMAGQSGDAIVAFRANGMRSTPFRHYKMTCMPLEDAGQPTWLFGSLTDIEDDFKKHTNLQEATLQISTVVEQVFCNMYVIDTQLNTICRLIKTEDGFRMNDTAWQFSEYISQRIENGVIAPESAESCGKLLKKGYLEQKTARGVFEMDVRLKLPGSLDYVWYADTISPIKDRPHRFMLSRKDVSAIYDARQREYELAESLRLMKYNQTMLDTMAGLVEFRNMETGAHIHHVRALTRILLEDIARRSPQYGLTAHRIDLYCQAATMHDIGKITLPDSILNKPGRLTPEEYDCMKTHSSNGADIIRGLDLPGQDELKQCCVDVAMHHHERWDGHGYPSGLIGDENSVYVQTVGLADVYDALVSERCYKKAYSFDAAKQMILGGSCGAFNPRLLESFIHCENAMRREYALTPTEYIERMEDDHGE